MAKMFTGTADRLRYSAAALSRGSRRVDGPDLAKFENLEPKRFDLRQNPLQR
jgi:hypothetical protein